MSRFAAEANARHLMLDFLRLPLSQRRFLAERYGVFTPGESETERNKRIIQAVIDQDKRDEFAALVAAAKSQ